MKTKTRKKTEKSKNKNREQVRIAVESVRGGHLVAEQMFRVSCGLFQKCVWACGHEIWAMQKKQ